MSSAPSHCLFDPEDRRPLFAGCIIAFDEKAALEWARLMAEGTAAGQPRSALDMMMAETAVAHGDVDTVARSIGKGPAGLSPLSGDIISEAPAATQDRHLPEATAPEPQTTRQAPWPAHADDLDALLEEAFRLFARGVADRRSPFHTPTIATVGPDGSPQARTMVLRSFDAPARRLSVHTDLRSGKLADLACQSRVAIHAYDPRHAVQVRLSAVARLHADDAVSQAAWAASRASSRAGYAIAPGPGCAVAIPPPMPQDPDAGRPHFAVLVLVFDQLEWLWLSYVGHRRARFDWGPEAQRQATWLVP